VSRRIREEFENGRDYYALAGKALRLPLNRDLAPAREYLDWHAPWGGEDRGLDQAIRNAAFSFLAEQTRLKGEVLPRDLLAEGFTFRGERVPLLGPQGIFKPRLLQIPLSLTTVPPVEGRDRPYADELSPDNLLIYKDRGTDPGHADNVGLRRAMERRLPLAYFHGVVPGLYLAAWPVFVVRDDPGALSFTVAVDSHEILA
jgi:putative restriction endonuclease